MKRLLLLFLLLPCAAQARPPPDPALLPTISLLTFAPGEIYWQRFGHNALLVRAPSGEATVYNYGIFDFQQKNFFLNFARGRMWYRLGTDSLWRTLAVYQRENRWVVEQRLNLLPVQARELADFLAWNAKPENANYRYDYFRDNCSTRVRDAIDRALSSALQRQLETQRTSVSYRHESVRMMSPIVPLALGIDLVDGPASEAPLNVWQQSFLPEVFMQALRDAYQLTPDGIRLPLVAAEGKLLSGSALQAPSQPLSFFWVFLAAGVLFGGALLWLTHLRARAVARITFAALAASFTLIGGVAGVILLLIWTLTEHWAWQANFNLLLLNPLGFLLLPTWIRSAKLQWPIPVWTRICVRVIAGLATLSLLAPQTNGAWIALLLPAHWALAAIILRHPLGAFLSPKTPNRENQ